MPLRSLDRCPYQIITWGEFLEEIDYLKGKHKSDDLVTYFRIRVRREGVCQSEYEINRVEKEKE